MGTRPPRRFPKIEVRHLDDDKIIFVLKDTDLSVANALRHETLDEYHHFALPSERVQHCLRSEVLAPLRLCRRVMISHVPTIAIDLVDMVTNSTVLHDEVRLCKQCLSTAVLFTGSSHGVAPVAAVHRTPIGSPPAVQPRGAQPRRL